MSKETDTTLSKRAAWAWLIALTALLAITPGWLASKTQGPLGKGGQMLAIECWAPTGNLARNAMRSWAEELGDPFDPAQKLLLEQTRARAFDWSDGLWEHPDTVVEKRKGRNALTAAMFSIMGGPDKSDLGWTGAVRASLTWDSWFIIAYVITLASVRWWGRPLFKPGENCRARLLHLQNGWLLAGGVAFAGLLDALVENQMIRGMVNAVTANGGNINTAELGLKPLLCFLAAWPKWIIAGIASMVWLGTLPRLLDHLGWDGLRETLQYVWNGVPKRPDDWPTRGWDGLPPAGADEKERQKAAEAVALYGEWFTSGTRAGAHFVQRFPELMIVVVALLALVCGWGTQAFGVPYLFIDPDAWWRTLLAGMGSGFLIGNIALCSCVLWTSEWAGWWQSDDLPETRKHVVASSLVDNHLKATMRFQCGLLIVCALMFHPPEASALRALLFGGGAIFGCHVMYLLFREDDPDNHQWDHQAVRVLRQAGKLMPHVKLGKDVERLLGLSHMMRIGALGWLLMAWFWPELIAWLTTALLLCVMLGTVAHLCTYVRFRGLLSRAVAFPLMIVSAGWLLSSFRGSSHPVYNHIFHDDALIDHYAQPVRVTKTVKEPASAEYAGISNEEAISAWRTRMGGPDANPVLVVVCAQGGGIMASAWATSVLTELQSTIPNFMSHVRVITGSSGGMVGAAHCVSALAASMPADWSGKSDAHANFDKPCELYRVVCLDSLHRSVAWMVLRDMPQVMVAPVLQQPKTFHLLPMNWFTWDRGEALQQKWEQNSDDTCCQLTRTFHDLADLERAGAIPSLIVSPTCVEDGRQLLISNLDLRYLEGVDVNGDSRAESRSVISLRGLLPEAVANMKLSTAARMTASFPFVSPAGELPTDPPLRLVDSGYNENYGVKLACLWVAQNLSSLREHTGGVVIVQIRTTLTTAQTWDHSADRNAPKWHVFSGLSSPLEGVLNARGGTMLLANDEHLYLTRHLVKSQGDNFPCDVVTFDCPYDASLSWHLIQEETKRLKRGLRTTETVQRGTQNWLKPDAPYARITALDLEDRTLGCATAEEQREALREQAAENNLREWKRLADLIVRGDKPPAPAAQGVSKP